MGVRHAGVVTGTGRFTLTPIDLGRRTRFGWNESLTLPVVARRAASARSSAAASCCAAIWNRNLRNLKAIVEHADGLTLKRRRSRARRCHAGADDDHEDQRRLPPRSDDCRADTRGASIDLQVLTADAERVLDDERGDQRRRDQRRGSARGRAAACDRRSPPGRAP